jgi:hypothetical protein
VVTFCILFLPVLAATSHRKHSNVSSSAMVAFAGHSQSGGGACTCGCQDCICDPGEPPTCIRTNGAVGQPNDKLPGRGTPSSQADYGTGALIVALALMFWLRLRA